MCKLNAQLKCKQSHCLAIGSFMALAGNKVGHILIGEPLGKGGMGTVYKGFDDKLKRDVAVKAIRKDHRLKVDSKARFLREARILSKLQHPNICQIFDYLEGEESDLLVLELIRGKNLKEVWMGELSFAEKLALAQQMASALAGAHATGVVHRDIKPQNVMVTNDGVVKVLDFGLSRTLDSEILSENSLPGLSEEDVIPDDQIVDQMSSYVKTKVGSLIGTLGYMSPEQARGKPATAASDIYALGLLLQEMFTGKSPYPPNLPFGAHLIKSSRGETLPIEGLDPDLTALINRLKSPVSAARPSAEDARLQIGWIRKKPKRRRKFLLVSGAIIALVAFAFIMTFQAVRIKREADRANREAERASQAAVAAREVSDLVQSLFEVSDPSQARGNSITARELLDIGSHKIHRLPGPPLTKARLMATMGTIYQKLGIYEQAQKLLEEALSIRETQMDQADLDLAENLNHLALVYGDRDRLEDGLALNLRALAIQTRLLGEKSQPVARTLSQIAETYWGLGRYEKAVETGESALALAESVFGPKHPDLANSMRSLGSFYDEMGRNSEAIQLLQRAIAIFDENGGDHPDLPRALNGLANVYSETERFAEAESFYRRVVTVCDRILGPDHAMAGTLQNNLAVTLDSQEKFLQAIPYYQRALEIWEKGFGPNHTRVALVLDNLGIGYRQMGEPAKAIKFQEKALGIWEKALGSEHGEIPFSLMNLGHSYARMGQFDEAARLFDRAFEILEKSGCADCAMLAVGMEDLAYYYLEIKRYEESEKFYRTVISLWDKLPEPNYGALSDALDSYADLLTQTGRPEDAKAYKGRAESERGKIKPTPDAAF